MSKLDTLLPDAQELDSHAQADSTRGTTTTDVMQDRMAPTEICNRSRDFTLPYQTRIKSAYGTLHSKQRL